MHRISYRLPPGHPGTAEAIEQLHRWHNHKVEVNGDIVTVYTDTTFVEAYARNWARHTRHLADRLTERFGIVLTETEEPSTPAATLANAA